jgi:hypothetical protein
MKGLELFFLGLSACLGRKGNGRDLGNHFDHGLFNSSHYLFSTIEARPNNVIKQNTY